ACAAGPVWSTVTAIVFRKTLLDQIGFFPETKLSIADFEWGIRAPLFTDTIHVAQPLATWRIRAQQATRSLDWAKCAWDYLDMIRTVCVQFAERVPVGLRSGANYRQLTLPKVYFAFDCLRLYPSEFRRHPARTIRNVIIGLWRAPGLTLRHLATGGSWSLRPQLDLRAHVHALLRQVGLPPICSVVAQPSVVPS
ncbi:MAG: hypothetical protein N3A53_00440, partial [Verrucomicrobiae bacterium]|nr:hypothetical protein [Verrucomicrobiae bacterium]